MKAMLLCAGAGLRMRPLTDQIPKPLVKVQGKSLVERHLQALARAGIREVVINVHHLGHQMIQTLGDGSALGISIQYSVEDPILETGGGVARALHLLGGDPFIVVSSDILTDFDFKTLPHTLPDSSWLHLVLVDNPPHHATGDYALKQGFLFKKGKNLLNFGGIGLYHPDLFKGAPQGAFPLSKIFEQAIANHRATGQHYSGFWHNVGTLEQLQALNEGQVY